MIDVKIYVLIIISEKLKRNKAGLRGFIQPMPTFKKIYIKR
jgi:hypothetical protein